MSKTNSTSPSPSKQNSRATRTNSQETTSKHTESPPNPPPEADDQHGPLARAKSEREKMTPTRKEVAQRIHRLGAAAITILTELEELIALQRSLPPSPTSSEPVEVHPRLAKMMAN